MSDFLDTAKSIASQGSNLLSRSDTNVPERSTTGNTDVRWRVELFPWETPYPQDDMRSFALESGSITELSSTVGGKLAGAASAIASKAKGFVDSVKSGLSMFQPRDKTASIDTVSYYMQDNKLEQKIHKSSGIRAISFSRVKGGNDDQCNIEIVGDVPIEIFQGTWVIISSFDKLDSQVGGSGFVHKSLPRFIGQVYAIRTRYERSSTGGLDRISTVSINSWSSVLNLPIRIDEFAVAANVANKNTIAAVGAITGALDKGSSAVSALMDGFVESKSPYGMARVILELMGAMNKSDLKSSDKMSHLPAIILKCPTMPQAILNRLGLPEVDHSSPYASGFMRMISGMYRPRSKDYTHTKWNGFFHPSKHSINEFVKDYTEDVPRSFTSGLESIILTNNLQAWELLTTQCDTTINEVFTDILYELNPEDGSVIAQPAIFVRDKPFLLESTKNTYGVAYDWTMYEDLPRIYIRPQFVASLELQSSYYSTYNLFRLSLNPQGLHDATGGIQTVAKMGAILCPDSITRFGGREYFAQSSYLAGTIFKNDGKQEKYVNAQEWSHNVTKLHAAWNAQFHKWPTGNIVLYDYHIPLSLGMNIEFSIGKTGIILVGHIESISTSCSVDNSGLAVTTHNVSLSHIMQKIPSGGLDFLQPELIHNLMRA